MKQHVNFNEGDYVIIEFNCDELWLHKFENMKKLKEYIVGCYEKEDIERVGEDTIFEQHFTESYVDGDSSSAKSLWQFKDGKLSKVIKNTMGTIYEDN